eukprot:scaffold5337_cov141-Skeletonema_menzelii.AAC.1
MSKPPPPKEWQPSQAERIANGILDYCPTGAAVNFPFLQQPLHYWPLPQAHQQNHPLMKQALPTPPLPVSFSNGNDAVHETKNDCQNGNDLDIDATDETNDNVSNAKDTTAATHGHCHIPDEDTETLRVGQVFANEQAFNNAVDTYCIDRKYDTKSFTTTNKPKEDKKV